MPKETIEQVLDKHGDSIMSLPGVVGVGEGECSGEPCIKIFVLEKTLELMGQFPRELVGYPVEVEETGEFKALNGE